MTSRVPATDSSVSWRHHGFSYYTVLPAGREYVQLLQEINTPDQSATPESAGEGAVHDEIRGSRVVLDVNDLVGESGYVELGLTRVSPDDRLLAWSVDHDRRRGLRAALPRPRDRARTSTTSSRAATTAAPGAPTRRPSSTPCTTTPTGPSRCGGTVVGTAADQDVLVLEEPDEQFEVMVRGDAQRRAGRDLVGEPRHQRGVGGRRPRPDLAPARSVGGRRRGVEYHAEHGVLPDGTDAPAARHQRRRHRVPARPVPVPRERRPGPHRVGGASAGGPGRAPRARRGIRRPRGARLPLGGPPAASHPADRRPRRRGIVGGLTLRGRPARSRSGGTRSSSPTTCSSWRSRTWSRRSGRTSRCSRRDASERLRKGVTGSRPVAVRRRDDDVPGS